MKRKLTTLLGLSALLLAAVGPANADVIDIVSAPGTDCTFDLGSGMVGDTCTTEAITPHSAWQSNNPNPPGYGGVWVSYADTGIGGDTLAQTNELPIFTIVESFTIASTGSIDFWIWADDTADLYFNLAGASLNLEYGANVSQNVCADGSIGCEADEYYNLVADLSAGTYDITMSMYQVGTGTTPDSNPFGVLYSGQVTSSGSVTTSGGEVTTSGGGVPTAVPEPGALGMLGSGLVAFALAGFRRQRRGVMSAV